MQSTSVNNIVTRGVRRTRHQDRGGDTAAVVGRGPGWAPIDDLDLGDVPADPRWSLMQELDRAARGTAAEWSPFRIQRRADYYDGGDGGPPVLGREVTITFDARMGIAELLGMIRAMWGYLRNEKAIRATRNRAIGPRKVALLRHVCIDAADRSWAERHAAWNRRHRGWRYDTTDAFITECHDAEEQLVGARRGLAWFYEPMARLSKKELARLMKSGNADAAREKARRADEWVRQVERMGIRVERYDARKRGGPERG